MNYRRRSVQRVIALIALPLTLSACASWQAQTGMPEQLIANQRPEEVRVTIASGQQLELRDPDVVGDTLRGSCTSAGSCPQVPLNEVIRVEFTQGDGARTTHAVLFGVGLVVAVALLALDGLGEGLGGW